MEIEENETCENCINKISIDALDYICNVDGEFVDDDSFACDDYEEYISTIYKFRG